MGRLDWILVGTLSGLALGCGSDGKGGTESAADGGGPQGQASDGGEPGVMAQSGTVVEVRDGKIQGDTDAGVRRFLGVPYAKPPVGDLRWRPPEPAEPWDGVRDALEYASPCAQPSWIQGPESDVEDCLYLNVWAPEPGAEGPLPVMVWLPGGGNQNGGASDLSPLTGGELIYDGASLAARGVVVVTINYRLGTFGFFAHPGLTAEGSNSGNQGLLDQQAALRWVRDNVAAFGGDPENVTLFGESAGSQDTCLQVVSPGARGLFHRAISESGGCTTYRKTRAEAEAQVAAFVEAVGCGGVDDELACLRGKAVPELLIDAPVEGAADAPGGSRFDGGVPLWDFNPVMDGTVLPDQPRTLADAGEFAKVPYILGSNFEEGLLFLLGASPVTTEAEYTDALGRLFGSAAAGVAAAYPAADFPTPQDALVRVWGDYRLGCTTDDSARRFAAGGAEVFTYAFKRSIPGLEALGPTHGTEMPYVFGTLPDPTGEDSVLVDAMQSRWVHFATTGDPNAGDAPTWPAFDEATDERMMFDVDLAVEAGYRRAECDFWRTIYDAAFP